LDTGASRTLLRRKEFVEICRDLRRQPILKPTVELCSLTGHQLTVMGETELPERIGGPIKVIIVDGMPHPAILGMDTLGREAVVNFAEQNLHWRGNDYPLRTYVSTYSNIASLGHDPPIIKGALIEEVVKDFNDLFSAKGEKIGCHPGVEMSISTTGGPIRQRSYRVPLTKRRAMEDAITELLEDGVIRPSFSPYASPCLLVPKVDNPRGRLVIDYSKLNAVTKKDAYPIPLIRDIFDQLEGATTFSILDLKSGYHQIPVAEEDIEKTAFTCHMGLFEFLRMPFGLTNAPAVFQRAMDRILAGLLGRICMVYIDDLVVWGKTEAEHAHNLRLVMDRLAAWNLKVKPSKCAFGLEEIKLLGYVVDRHGMRPDPAKAAAIADLGAPQGISEIRSFLGMSGYYRPCMPQYAHIAEPLVKMTRKNAHFTWTGEQQRAFQALKDLLISDKVMAHPQMDKPYKLYTDACDYAIGAILCQLDEKGIERPVVYLSKQLTATQRRWATIEKEAYAVVYALRQLRPYVWGADFKVYTDHKPLTCLFTKEMNNTKIQRWQVLLAEYGAKVEYRKGKNNIRADMLSRIRQREEVSALDTADWIVSEKSHATDPGLALPILHDHLDLSEIGHEQRSMAEWTEAIDPESQYDLVNEVLYSSKKPTLYAPDYPRLVLPPSSRGDVIMRAHTEVGHMGALKTLRKVQEAYVWPGMKADIVGQLRKCSLCVVHRRRQIHLPMGEMPIATAPGQIIGADLIGPFVTSPAGNVYVLTIIDHCTGHAEAYAIPRKTNEAVWSVFRQQYFPRYGYPEVLITDQGLEFNALAFRAYLQGVGVKHQRTTPYNPQGNGRTERFNRTFKGMLNKLVNNRRDEWEDQLGTALMAYNNSTSTVTGYTPFFLMYGRRARLPLTTLLHPPSPLVGRLQDLSEGLQHARAMTEESRKHNRERLARKANAEHLEVGDSVVIKANEPLSTTSRWDPHWTVTQIRGKVIFLHHDRTGQVKVLNHNKVQLIDPDISWDEVNPRPIRQTNRSTRLIGVRAQPAHIQVTAAVKHPNLIQEGFVPDPPVPLQPTKRKASAPEHDRITLPSRTRHYLPRATKTPQLVPPTPSAQKRARIDAIACVSARC